MAGVTVSSTKVAVQPHNDYYFLPALKVIVAIEYTL